MRITRLLSKLWTTFILFSVLGIMSLEAQTTIPVTNGDFELPATTDQIRSWADPSIPGWTSDDPQTNDEDSGIQNGNGGRVGYLKSSSPYNPYQTTDHVIATEGTNYTVSFVFGDGWACTNGTVILYYLDADGVTRVPLGSKTVAEDNYVTTYTFTVQSTAASVGHPIGIEFDNPDTWDSWLNIDNVTLTYSNLGVDATLSALSVDAGSTLIPAFDPETTSYLVTIPTGVTNINVTPVLNDANASFTGGGAVDVSGGETVRTITVTAENGVNKKDYTLTFVPDCFVPMFTDKANLVPDPLCNNRSKFAGWGYVSTTTDPALVYCGSSSIAFAGITNSWDQGAALDVPNINYTANKTYRVRFVYKTIDGSLGLRANCSPQFNALLEHTQGQWAQVDTFFTVTSTSTSWLSINNADNGATGKVAYIDNFEIYEVNNDASLSGLTSSVGTIGPAFNSEITSYGIAVDESTTSVTLTATANNATSTVSGDGEITLTNGAGTANIVVTAESGKTRTYVVQISNVSTDATLSDIILSEGTTLSPSFDAQTTNYFVYVPTGVTGITVTPTLNDANASFTGGGSVDVSAGETVETITVKAEDGVTTKNYTLTFVPDCFVPMFTDRANLVPDPLCNNRNAFGGWGYVSTTTDPALVYCGSSSIAFAGITNSWNQGAALDVSDINYTAGTTYRIRFVYKTIDGSIALRADCNPRFDVLLDHTNGAWAQVDTFFTVTSTAASWLSINNADNAATGKHAYIDNYEIYEVNNDVSLSDLTTSAGTLTPEFSTGTKYYKIILDPAVSSVTLTAAANSTTSTVTGDGLITLTDDVDTANIVVTAESGKTQTYTVIIARPSTAGATVDNPADLTVRIFNPDFEYNGGSTQGWTTTLGIYNGGNAVFDGAPSPNHVLDGDPVPTTVGYQTVTDIPAGVYKVKAIARGRNDGDAAKMFISAEAGNVFGSVNRTSVQVNRIGDTGGELNYGFNSYEVPFVVLPVGVNEITFGIYFEGDCGWSSVDNFELYYIGEVVPVVNDLKNKLTALKDSSDLPAGYDVSEIVALLNTELSTANETTLPAELENAINLLEGVIAENVDATLSDLTVDGETIKHFSPTTYTYEYNFYSSTPQTPAVPTVSATKNSSYAADPVIDDATAVPGTTSVTVTAGNGSEKTYTIGFDFVLLDYLENYTATFETYENKFVEIGGAGQLTITGDMNPLNGSHINLVSTDEWIYFPNMIPSQVVSTQLEHITVNGETAIEGSNIRVSQYLDGAMVIPHSITYQPLTVYDGANTSGTSMKLQINKYYKTSDLGAMNDKIESFKLERGYMATFASNEDGTGISRVYIADNNDITVNAMPDGLSNTASFVIIRQWRWTTKKGWVGGMDEWPLRFGAKSCYDYYNATSSTLDVEFIPMAAEIGAINSNFLDRLSSTHALFLNEPWNSSDGETNTVAEAVAAWPQMMASGLRLGAPANTDGNLWWLYDFVDQCDANNYRVDFVAWHFYRANYTPIGFYNTIKAIHERTGRPLWITEWNNGCNWTYDGNVPSIWENGVIVKEFTEILDTTSFVERYFVWNGCNEELRMTNSATGELYPAGIAYRDQVSSISYTKDYYNTGEELGTSIIQENSVGVCNVEGTIKSTNGGYTGIGYIDADDASGGGIDWNVNFTSSGVKTITFRYASTENKTANLVINGETVASDLYFVSTGGLNLWYKLPVTINSEIGTAAIRLESTVNSGLPNIDYVELTEGLGVDCSATSLTDVDESSTIVYPTVSGGSFTVKTDSNSSVITVYSMIGTVVSKTAVTGYVTRITVPYQGMYIIQVESMGKTENFKVIKK